MLWWVIFIGTTGGILLAGLVFMAELTCGVTSAKCGPFECLDQIKSQNDGSRKIFQ